MKRSFLFFAFAFLLSCYFPFSLSAQAKKGDLLFGAMATVDQHTPGLPWLRSGRYDVFGQRFLTPHFSVGGSINYRYSGGYDNYRFHSMGFGLESRYYFLKGPFRPFVYGGLETNWYKMNYAGATPTWMGLRGYGGAGFDWFIRPNFALTARAGIAFDNVHTGNPRASWDYKVGVTFSIPHKEKKKLPVNPER